MEPFYYLFNSLLLKIEDSQIHDTSIRFIRAAKKIKETVFLCSTLTYFYCLIILIVYQYEDVSEDVLLGIKITIVILGFLDLIRNMFQAMVWSNSYHRKIELIQGTG